MLQLSRKVLRGRERVHDNISLTVQAVAAQLCPAAVHCLQALVSTLGKAQQSVDTPGVYPDLCMQKAPWPFSRINTNPLASEVAAKQSGLNEMMKPGRACKISWLQEC